LLTSTRTNKRAGAPPLRPKFDSVIPRKGRPESGKLPRMGPWNGMSISDGNTPPRAGDCFASGTWFFKASNAMLYRSPHRGHTLQAMIQLELRVPPNLQCPGSNLESHLDNLRGWVWKSESRLGSRIGEERRRQTRHLWSASNLAIVAIEAL
jgi:hypothetical protein